MTASADTSLRLLHDRALAGRARTGDVAAFHEVRRRHAAATWRLALVVTRSAGAASAAVRSAFGSVLGHPERTPVDLRASLRSQLLTATREAALTAPTVSDAPPTAADDTLPVDPGVPVAFHQLPELWRSVLWLTDVEELPVAEVATVLDLTDEGVEKLLGRAREGIHEQLTQEQAAGLPGECRRATTQLGAYAAHELAPRAAARVRRHLDACAECRARLEMLDDTQPGLRRSLVAMPILLVGDLESAWAAALVSTRGPLHLTLPGGRPVPAWAERTIAGAAAAVITVGITGAVLSGRGKGGEDLVRETATEQSFGTDDGEVALGGDPGSGDQRESGSPAGDPSDGGNDPTASSPTTVGPSSASAGDGGRDQAAENETPRGSAPPAPTSPAPPPPGPTPSTPPTTQAPVLEVTVGLDDTLGVTIGDDCTDLTLLGTSLDGCGGQEASGIEVGGSLLPPVELGL